MLFYNDEGNENGGLVFGGHRNANGDVVDAGVALSFDRYGASSQFVQLAGVQDSQNHIVGLTLSETEPTGNRRRLFLGHDKDGVASVVTDGPEREKADCAAGHGRRNAEHAVSGRGRKGRQSVGTHPR